MCKNSSDKITYHIKVTVAEIGYNKYGGRKKHILMENSHLIDKDTISNEKNFLKRTLKQLSQTAFNKVLERFPKKED